MSLFLASVGFGLVTAAVLAIAAVGFTMQFAVTDVLNLAYGAVMIASAFVAYAVNQAGASVWVGLLAGTATGAVGSVALNQGIYMPFQRRGSAPITMVIVSLGMTLIIEFGLQAIVGGTNVSYTMSQGPTVRAGGLELTAVQFVIIGLSIVLCAAVHGLLRYTKLGRAMRATAANRNLARNCGIRTARIVTLTWAITGALCGAGRHRVRDQRRQLRRDQRRPVPGSDPRRGVPRRPGPGLRRDGRRGDHRPRHRGQRRVHRPVLQGRDRVRGAARDAGDPAAGPARGEDDMTAAQLFYIINLLIYAGVDVIACLGLSQQFGVAGVTNFGFIIFQAAGAYTAAVLSLPGDSANGGFQSYIFGWNLPWPIPWIGAAIAGGLVALPFTFLVGRRLRGDFAAVGLLVTAVMTNLLVTNYRPAFGGAAGLSLVPAPLQGEFNPQSQGYQWAYTASALILAAGAYLLVRRVTESPYGRSLRAMRDNDTVADSLGKNLLSMRAAVLVLGGALAGLSGAILVGFISLWAPSAWGYAETIVLFAAVIIGGAGNHRGALLGAILVPVGFEEATRYIPQFGPPGLIDDLQWVAIGLLIVVFLWFRPQGILPEKRRIAERPEAQPPVTVTATTVSSHEVVLSAEHLVREFGGFRAVDDVSLEVRRGTLTGLIGPNGAGKSTLLAMLAGTLPVTSGQVWYLGRDVTAVPAYRRARLGLVRTYQLASEFKRLTVLENLLSAVPRHRGDSLRGALLGWG